ncbi:MarR family winged helix-turn-helix transcriptional regulator [Paenibacillus sp. y28]|uniref:MarR family winged helix-turn-helix transcriptional regulator n=1 Tax=Paenibacillus sp. y28 TaxID=3129110 RepID=UPI0030163712
MEDFTTEQAQKKVELLQSFGAISKTTTQLFEKDAERCGLNMPQLTVLNTLLQFSELTLDELAAKRFTPKTTMSGIVQKLAALGYIEREKSQEGRREVKYKLTPAGEDLSQTAGEESSVYVAMTNVLAQISEEDIQTLLRIHADVLKCLQVELEK